MKKVVLISPVSLPTKQISSWPKMYDYLIGHYSNVIHYIICPRPIGQLYSDILYSFAKSPHSRIMGKLLGYKYYYYIKLLVKLLNKENTLIVKIIDNVTLLMEIHQYLTNKGLRDKVKIYFFMHGYSYFFDTQKGNQFYNALNHIVFLTNESYRFEVLRNHAIPCQVSVLYNGVESKKFYKVEDSEKNTLRQKLGLLQKNIFLWIANDRPKKGLSIIVEAWKKSNCYKNNETVLLVIGTNQQEIQDNIQYLGKLPHEELSIYYQSADFFLFTTLCHEGFPLSLTEAIKCGCTCFVSDIDPMQEVTKNGQLAHLIKDPNMVSSWVTCLNAIKENKYDNIPPSKDTLDQLYDIDDWCKNIKYILS